MTKASGIAFYSPCWLWRLTSSVQTDASCTAKWNMYANFLRMNFGEEAVIQGEQILLNLFEQQTDGASKPDGI